MKKSNNNKNQITRKEALSKMGKYAALTAIGTFIALNPRKSQAVSLPPPSNDGIFDD
ncbi:hypothetical protein FORMB_10140 [Formosa sp. Hel1_33_131]|uniref:hypothetical protein n=1 Tax=Formosa sp. Hel1_33_131 TaxID=1336794 RepID=UPI000866048B|nr:hypothetical protein [Formosa sp. Hel1_33_131]AOR28064.1 hypothetical protein FORMB_10140 [Formosa sp. Hel1_33_131]